MNDNTYNGYTGNGTRESAYATWNVALWIDNEYSIYVDKVCLLKSVDERVSASDVETFARVWFPEGTPDMQGEDGYGSMDLVNWDELAEDWTREISEYTD